MDESRKHDNPNPYETANPLSKLFFWWMNPLLKLGYGRQLEVEDMYNVCDEDQSAQLGAKLEKEWKKELDKVKDGRGKPSLSKALIRTYGLKFMLYGMILSIKEGIGISQPLLMAGLIRYFTPTSTVSKTEAYLYAMGVSLCAIANVLTLHPYFFGMQRLSMKLRIACCSLIYRKGMKYLHFFWIGPLVVIAVITILWIELGPYTIAGFAALLLQVPFEMWMGKLISKFRQETAKETDERIRLMNEIITGMRVIKMYCWEKPFGDFVEKVRSKELKVIFAKLKVVSVSETLMIIGKLPFIFAIVLTATLLGVHIRPEMIFLVVAYGFRTSEVFNIGWYMAVIFGAELKVTIGRLENFMQLNELTRVEQNNVTHVKDAGEYGIEIDVVKAKWDKSLEQYTLHGITASVKPGELLAVIGPVGSGKSSLLMSVLQEMPEIEGCQRVKGNIAYVSQQPWVFSASVRQNITFGNEFDKAKYDKILTACAMDKDIAIMPHGDMTMIGERGVRLSGGQRARVSLARALYMDADVYLLDDPLSAVDAVVGRHLFERVVQGLLKERPRILVTHQLQYLKEADHIVVLKEGEMIGSGTFNELSTSGIDFTSLLKRDNEEGQLDGHYKSHGNISNDQQMPQENCNQSDTKEKLCIDDQRSPIRSLNSAVTDFKGEAVQLPEEERHKGTVGGLVYYQYFRAGAGVFNVIIITITFLLAQVVYNMSDWWLAYWSNQEEDRFAAIEIDMQLHTVGQNISNVSIPIVDAHVNLGVFSAFVGSVFVFGVTRALIFFKIVVGASQKLHNTMFASVLRSHICFFDRNPVGRILNRFSKDIGSIDDLLPIAFFACIQTSLLALGIIIVVGIVNPWVFIPVVPLGIIFVLIVRYYLRTARHIKRLEGTTRSPVFSHLSSTLQSLQTIRAFRVQDKFIEEFDKHQDLHTEAWFLFLGSSIWLGIALDWLCVTFVATVSFFCVFAAENLNAGLVGLTLTSAIGMLGKFQWAVRQSAEVENQMISVERVLDYCRLPSEAPLTVDEKKQPPPDWPQQGAISAVKASLQYFPDSPVVLKELSFHIKSREKVGIVGRTGAGKSSMITMLLRLVEPSGKVVVDGVDIQDIGLHDLRHKLSVIPQDPILFMVTLRRNLDPFGEYDDSVLWRSLSEVELKQTVEDLPYGLDTEVSEGGVNFSVGQRQLICLARAIMRRNKILMIDEATANVDPMTDALIQRTIRDKFQNSTVLTIAHRLNTIMDSDRIMVLDDGEITEFDMPYTLLQKGSGSLYNMFLQTGKAEMEHLTDIARKSFEKTRFSSEAACCENDAVCASDSGVDELSVRSCNDDVKSDENETKRGLCTEMETICFTGLGDNEQDVQNGHVSIT